MAASPTSNATSEPAAPDSPEMTLSSIPQFCGGVVGGH